MRTIASAAALLILAGAFAACSDREEPAGPDQSPAAQTATATTTAPPTATATAQPGRELAAQLAASPAFFIYVTGPGDTVSLVADTFDGLTGSADAAFEDELRDVNRLGTVSSLPVGYELAVPLRLPSPDSLFQANTMAEALRAGQAGDTIPLLVPSQQLLDGFVGRLALHRVELATGDIGGEGRGFLVTFAVCDRVAVKGGELDREARVDHVAFLAAGGSLVAKLQKEHPDAYLWRQGGHTFGVAILDPASGEPSRVGALLEEAQ